MPSEPSVPEQQEQPSRHLDAEADQSLIPMTEHKRSNWGLRKCTRKWRDEGVWKLATMVGGDNEGIPLCAGRANRSRGPLRGLDRLMCLVLLTTTHMSAILAQPSVVIGWARQIAADTRRLDLGRQVPVIE